MDVSFLILRSLCFGKLKGLRFICSIEVSYEGVVDFMVDGFCGIFGCFDRIFFCGYGDVEGGGVRSVEGNGGFGDGYGYRLEYFFSKERYGDDGLL